MMKPAFLALVLLATASPAVADVKPATPIGFEAEAKAVVKASPAKTYAALTRIGEWWDSEHTYSGDASNMTLVAKAGGCFCETIPDGGGTIEHGRVIYARPSQTLRLQGSLGPLQSEAATGTLTWQLKPVDGGTEITQSYVVGGYIRGSAAKLAPIIDQVMGQQLARLAEYLGKSATSAD